MIIDTTRTEGMQQKLTELNQELEECIQEEESLVWPDCNVLLGQWINRLYCEIDHLYREIDRYRVAAGEEAES